MNVLVKPIITEKMTGISEKLNRYGFIVDRKANKHQIKDAIENMYDVKVTDVNTMYYAGKNKTRFTKTAIVKGKKNDFKKAIVSLADGQVIDFFSNI